MPQWVLVSFQKMLEQAAMSCSWMYLSLCHLEIVASCLIVEPWCRLKTFRAQPSERHITDYLIEQRVGIVAHMCGDNLISRRSTRVCAVSA